MENPAPAIQAFFARRVRENAGPARVTEAVVAAWQQITSALAPVVGQRGVAALYRRSLHIAAETHPALLAAHSSDPATMDLELLKPVMLRLSGEQAAAAGTALLLGFHELVGSLIGPALTSQLLGAVWTHVFSGPAAQDPAS